MYNKLVPYSIQHNTIQRLHDYAVLLEYTNMFEIYMNYGSPLGSNQSDWSQYYWG